LIMETAYVRLKTGRLTSRSRLSLACSEIRRRRSSLATAFIYQEAKLGDPDHNQRLAHVVRRHKIDNRPAELQWDPGCDGAYRARGCPRIAAGQSKPMHHQKFKHKQRIFVAGATKHDADYQISCYNLVHFESRGKEHKVIRLGLHGLDDKLISGQNEREWIMYFRLETRLCDRWGVA
jgi:hypothetical protein